MRTAEGIRTLILTEYCSPERHRGCRFAVHHSPAEAGTPRRNKTRTVLGKIVALVLPRQAEQAGKRRTYVERRRLVPAVL